MLVLATDTSGKQGSIALAEGEPDGTCRVLEVWPLAGGMFSAELVPQVAALLARHGFNRHDIAAFAVASGPGSFTGLRVGLAAIKALGEVLGKPIAAVSLLEAVAVAGSSEGSSAGRARRRPQPSLRRRISGRGTHAADRRALADPRGVPGRCRARRGDHARMPSLPVRRATEVARSKKSSDRRALPLRASAGKKSWRARSFLPPTWTPTIFAVPTRKSSTPNP